MMPALTNRCATLVELKDQVRAYTDELLDPSVVLSATDEPLLRACVDIVQEHALHWNAEAVIESLRAWAQTHEASFSSIAKALRLALTGRSVSPGLNDVMQALGPCVTLARLKAVLYQDARPADSQVT
jgi:glutamyl-tRNA synthetase